MKKFVLVLYLLLPLFFIGCAQREIKNIDSQGKNIICFGDSITSGEGASPGKDYPTILAQNLSWPVINAGSPGDTTQNALNRLTSDVLDKDPLLVIVILGGNDFLMKIPMEETFNNLDRIVKIIQEKGAIVALGEMRAGIIMRRYSSGYRRIAKRYRCLLIPDLLEGIIDNPNLKDDYIHPNDAGYKALASKILKVIQPVLEKNRLVVRKKR